MDVQSLSNLRSHGQVFAQYTTDFRQVFPYLTDPHATFSVIRCPSRAVAIKVLYFDCLASWSVGLADGYYNGDVESKVFWPPHGAAALQSGGAVGTGYLYGCGFLADPAFFDPSTQLEPPGQLRPVRDSEVEFPAFKGLLSALSPWSFDRLGLPGAVHGVFCDGHAEVVPPTRLLPALSSDGPYPSYSTHAFSLTPPLLHTVGGVRGRDVRD